MMTASLLLSLLACAPSEAPATDSGVGEVPLPIETDGPASPPALDTGPVEVLPMDGFSFVDDHLAGMPRPWGDDFAFLADEQIALLVGLRLDPVDDADLVAHGLDYLHLPIEDFHAPTLEQQEAFVAAVRERLASGQRVGVHCTAGLGRTGTMLATWFVAEGMSPADAIDHVRQLRPGSIETDEQEQAVARFGAATR